MCDCRPIRQDLLDQIVWQEVVRLIEDPTLIQAELDRRLDAARGAEPTKRRQDALERELTRIRKSMERLVTAYQEDLLPLDELRRRMPELRAREQSARAELQAILDQVADRMSFLRLAETLAAFLQRLHELAQSLEIADRQKIVRLLVKDILVDNDTITIRYRSRRTRERRRPEPSRPQTANRRWTAKVAFCVRGVRGPLRRSFLDRDLRPVRDHHRRFQHQANQGDDPWVLHAFRDPGQQALMMNSVKEFGQVEINHRSIAVGLRISRCFGDGGMSAAFGAESVTAGMKVGSKIGSMTWSSAC